MVAPGGCLLAVEPKMHVNRGEFEKMCRVGETIGWEVEQIPVKKGGLSILFRHT